MDQATELPDEHWYLGRLNHDADDLQSRAETQKPAHRSYTS